MKIEMNTSLLGPLMADSLDDDYSIIDQYITTNSEENSFKDKYISGVLSDERVALSGVRGSGKTMILKVVNELLKRDLNYQLHYVEAWERGGNDKKILPVFMSFSGFKEEVSLKDKENMTEDEIKETKEIFRGYFFMAILQEILKTINSLRLDENVEFNFCGLRTKFGIKKEIDRAITAFKRKGFQEVVNSNEKGGNADLNIKILNGGMKKGNKSESKEILLNDMQKVMLFKETVDSICMVYGFDKIMFLFDEVHYLRYLQAEFFDTLFGFRSSKRISYAISTYPAFMDYGEKFDIPDDAKEIPISTVLYKPSKIATRNN